MEHEIQEVIDRLESLQFDILVWQKKEKSRKRKKMLSDYDSFIDDTIEILYEYGLAD